MNRWNSLSQMIEHSIKHATCTCSFVNIPNIDIHKINKKRYDSELPYQRPDLIEVMEIEIDLTTSTNVHTGFYISVRECLD